MGDFLIENRIREKIILAKTIADEMDEQYKVATFKIVLMHLLKNENQERQERQSTSGKEKIEVSKLEKLSLREFVHLTKAKSHTENTAAISFYLLKYHNIRSFNYKQILDEFDKAMFDKPTNIRDILNKMIKRRLLEETEQIDNLKGYKLTKTGVNFVEKLLADSKNN